MSKVEVNQTITDSDFDEDVKNLEESYTRLEAHHTITISDTSAREGVRNSLDQEIIIDDASL